MTKKRICPAVEAADAPRLGVAGAIRQPDPDAVALHVQEGCPEVQARRGEGHPLPLPASGEATLPEKMTKKKGRVAACWAAFEVGCLLGVAATRMLLRVVNLASRPEEGFPAAPRQVEAHLHCRARAPAASQPMKRAAADCSGAFAPACPEGQGVTKAPGRARAAHRRVARLPCQGAANRQRPASVARLRRSRKAAPAA